MELLVLEASREDVFPQACDCKGRCDRVEAEAETPSPAAAQAQVEPVGVDGELWSTSGGTFGDMCLPKDWEEGFDSDVLSGTSDSDADGYSDASADSCPGGRSVTLEELYDDGF